MINSALLKRKIVEKFARRASLPQSFLSTREGVAKAAADPCVSIL
jgi:hypothetical protein